SYYARILSKETRTSRSANELADTARPRSARTSTSMLSQGIRVAGHPSMDSSIWSGMSWMSMIAVTGLAAVHVFAGKLRFLEGTPRSAWLSVAAGISVAYVFLYLLPELAARQSSLQEAADGFFSFVEHHAYVAALAGLTTFYGLERASKAFRRRAEHGSPHDQGTGIFWTHMLLLAFYNMLIGYLLAKHTGTAGDLVFFVIAMALH